MPLLTTKLYIPSVRPESVPRPRLIGQLDKGLAQKLVLVSAPAGFGKTTLLSEWIHTSHVPAAWVSLDESDNDPARFLAYVIAALQTIEESIGRGILEALQSPQPPAMEELYTVLINQIQSFPATLALVLDDYHLITVQSIHHAVEFLLDHLPQNLHLIIAARSDPPLPIARLRGRGQLVELRQNDLRFTSGETRQFLDQAMGLTIQAEDAAALARRTEGWVAGLQMAALSMQKDEDVHKFIAEFTGRQHYILDYLIEEVLQRQPESVQSFLLQTSILDRMTGSLCDALLDTNNSHTMLETLEHANLFIVPLDDKQQWHRYHHLFADLLRHRLNEVYPSQAPNLHRRASEWHERNGQMAEAIEHALSGSDFERAASLLSKQAEALWARGECVTLSRLLETLPDEFISAWPDLTIHHALVLFIAGRIDEAEQHLQMAEHVLSTSPDPSSRGRDDKLQGMIATVKASVALFRGDVHGMAHFSRQALEYLTEENSMWRSGAAVILGDAHSWRGDLSSAIRSYTEAMAASRAIGNIYYALMAAAKIAINEMQQGHLRRAAEVCRDGLQLAEKSGFAKTAKSGALMSTLGRVLCEWNDLDGALEYAQTGVTLCEQDKNIATLGYSYATLTMVLATRNDAKGVEDAFQKLEKLEGESQVPDWIMGVAVAWKAYSLLTQNQLEAAAYTLRECRQGADDHTTFGHYYEYLMLARLIIAQGQLSEASRLIERLARVFEGQSRVGWIIETLAVRALILQEQGEMAQALESLKRALELAEPEGYVRVFINKGEPMARLLHCAVAEGLAPHEAYVHRLRVALEGGTMAESPPSPPMLDQSSLVERLSEREVQVLRLLTTDLSTTDMADQLFVSVNTVRTHIRSIYEKLGVHTRYEAIARAKELTLL